MKKIFSGLQKSTLQRIANQAQQRHLSRGDALVAYAMDRLLYRLGRSAQAREFFLKGGLLVANLVSLPHRFTRDIDLLRRHGPPDPEDIRRRFQEVLSVRVEDGVHFDPSGLRVVQASRELDGYDGVRVTLRARVGNTDVDIPVDIGFGDALVPPAERLALVTFLEGDPAAEVYAYEAGPVLAEKIETLLSKFPLVEHRLKDLLDVVILARQQGFEGPALVASLRATFERRQTPPELRILDEMHTEFTSRRWVTRWAVMRREKAVSIPVELPEALATFDTFVRPLLQALAGEPPPRSWLPGGPWS
ncbi:MAG TPA: nucleotidyl transferase AbiEii/AbiGii toxin family protein [Myxococcota bacterium]|nr:nucleotidyl transferase AbiEii/AbiGii toxin family protein [Myxococcota bacterium]